MDDTKPRQEESEVIDRAVAAMMQPNLNARLVKTIDGQNIVDFSDVIGLYKSLPEYRKVLLMVLLLALRDKATEVRFEPWKPEADVLSLRLFLEVDGQLLELEPPPQYAAAPILKEIKEVAGFHSLRRRLAHLLRRLASTLDAETQHQSQSSFRLKTSGEVIEVSATVYTSPMGDRVFLRIPSCSESMTQKAREALTAILGP